MYGQLATTEPSDWLVMVAVENSGCAGGIVTGAHDAEVTFHRNCAAIEGADVGAVGDCEHPIANSNKSPHNERVTIILLGLAGAAVQRSRASRGYRDTAIYYSDVVPLKTLRISGQMRLNSANDAALIA